MDGNMHKRMTAWACRKAAACDPIWEKRIRDAEASSNYPDMYLVGEADPRNASWDPLWRVLDQIPLESGVCASHLFYTSLDPRKGRPMFEYLIHLAVTALKEGNEELGVKAVGIISHHIADTVQPAHATDNRMVTAMWPQGEWRYMTHVFIEEVTSELPGEEAYQPRLLAADENMLAWRLCEELEMARQKTFAEIPCIMEARRRHDEEAAKASACRSALLGARLLADVMRTVSYLLTQAEGEVSEVALTDLYWLDADVDNMFNYLPMIDALPSQHHDRPIRLNIGAGEVRGLCLLPMMMPGFMDVRDAWVAYSLPGQGLIHFEAQLGIQRFSGELHPCRSPGNQTSALFEIRLDDECVWRSEPIDETMEPVTVRIPLGKAKKLTLYVRDAREPNAITKFVYPVIANPILR